MRRPILNHYEELRMQTTTLRGGSRMVEHMRRIGTDIVLRATATVSALGQEIPYADFEARLPPMQVSHAERVPGAEDDWNVTLVPIAAEEIEVFLAYRPVGSGGEVDR